MSKQLSGWKNLENNGAMPKYGRRGMLVNMDTGDVEWNMGKWVIKTWVALWEHNYSRTSKLHTELKMEHSKENNTQAKL